MVPDKRTLPDILIIWIIEKQKQLGNILNQTRQPREIWTAYCLKNSNNIGWYVTSLKKKIKISVLKY